MKDNAKKTKNVTSNKSRRDFLKTAAVAGGAAAGVLGFPGVMRLSAAEPINIKMQTAWDAGTLGFVRSPRES
jgi:anaerobic selenocysteine-containing dehydrogenase